MGKKVYTTGLMPADCAPTTAEKKPRGVDNLADRLEGLGTTRSTPLTQVKAALYLHRFDDGRELALYLGLSEAYDGISRVRAAEA